MLLTSRGTRSVAVAAAVAAAVLSALVVPQPAQSAGPACGKKLAMLGALTGDAGALGQNMVDGAFLAISQYNAEHPGCTVGLINYDSQGDPATAVPLATAIIENPSILGVVGPAFSGESLATGRTFFQAGLATVTPSATNPTVSRQGWKTFHRLISSDTGGGPRLAAYIRTTLKGSRVAVVTDGQDYSRQFVAPVRAGLGKRVVLNATVRPGQTNFRSVVATIKAAKVKVVLFGGYYNEGGHLAGQLRKAGVTARFVTGEGSTDPAFRKIAGAVATARAIFIGTYAPSNLSATFTKSYRKKYGTAPGIYALEAYDVANVFLDGLNAGKGTRASMLAFVHAYNRLGLTKRVAFTSKGELIHPVSWVYKLDANGLRAVARLR
ncbi:MAG: Extracellular ligand-binding receptor [Marmoricola sp.]|nr:Extracellular ligand-binding receptor [Marmoricola sp.]